MAQVLPRIDCTCSETSRHDSSSVNCQPEGHHSKVPTVASVALFLNRMHCNFCFVSICSVLEGLDDLLFITLSVVSSRACIIAHDGHLILDPIEGMSNICLVHNMVRIHAVIKY